jgi:hypothetical protein
MFGKRVIRGVEEGLVEGIKGRLIITALNFVSKSAMTSATTLIFGCWLSPLLTR